MWKSLPLFALLAGSEAMRLGVSTRPARANVARSSSVSMGLQFDESKAMAGDPNAKNYRKLSDALKEADLERTREEREAQALMREQEEKRNRRAKKIELMNAIPDSAPAGKVRGVASRCALSNQRPGLRRRGSTRGRAVLSGLLARLHPPRPLSRPASSCLASCAPFPAPARSHARSDWQVGDFMYRDGVSEVLDKLDHDMIGLRPVKQRVRDIASLLVIDKMRRKLGLDTSIPSLHMCFTGAPGTGKTTVAMKMGQILQRMGYCRHGGVVVATRDDLVGQYVGHTAPKTKEMIKKAFGGILLIDEAYYLYNAANDKDYGQESIEILLNVMENQKDDLIVTLAGYKDRMDKFFSYIPGMSSRIGNHIDFPNYEPDELVDIAKVMARELEYTFADDAVPVLKEYIAKRMELPFFSNARTVRNALDRARMRQANRLFIEKLDPSSDGNITPEELQMFTAADMPTAAELVARGDSAIVE
jgi:probable Rubsico expression protein CbbX